MGGKVFEPIRRRQSLAYEENNQLSITTEIIKYDENLAVIRAITTTMKGNFPGLGMASIERDHSIAPAILELAETRAIARSLRFAGYGVEYCSAEEISHLENGNAKPPAASEGKADPPKEPPKTPTDGKPGNVGNGGNGDARITNKQLVVQDYETAIKNQKGELAASYFTSWHRFSRSESKEQGKCQKRGLATYTKEDIEKIKADYKKEKRRGAQTLRWEDVTEGEGIPFILKGPTTAISQFAFESWGGAGGWFVGPRLAFELFERPPGLPFINEQGIPEAPVAIHWSNERCQNILGLPGAYEAGTHYEVIDDTTPPDPRKPIVVREYFSKPTT